MSLSLPPPTVTQPILQAALAEDLGSAGDITTDAIVAADLGGRATIASRSAGRIAGLSVALDAFTLLDGSTVRQVLVADGASVVAGERLATVRGPARAILTGERVVLNVLARLSGIATTTAAFVAAVHGTGVRVLDTRKTTPGWRALEKYAVRVGGGSNHRFGLYDAVLIKDNHIAAAGGLREAVQRAREQLPTDARVEVEVDGLVQLEEALDVGVDAVLLDNMDLATLRRAVTLTDRRATLEASGGITIENARAIAMTGVDSISIGWLTHSAPALDVGLDLEYEAGRHWRPSTRASTLTR